MRATVLRDGRGGYPAVNWLNSVDGRWDYWGGRGGIVSTSTYDAGYQYTVSKNGYVNISIDQLETRGRQDRYAALFVDGVAWSIVQREEVPVYQVDEDGKAVLGENGNPIQTGTEMQENEFDNSEYNIAGDLTDHRDGRITAKMGKLTDLEEAYEIMLGGIE